MHCMFYSGSQKYRTAGLVIIQQYVMHVILRLATWFKAQIIGNNVLNLILLELEWNIDKC